MVHRQEQDQEQKQDQQQQKQPASKRSTIIAEVHTYDDSDINCKRFPHHDVFFYK